jgi:putative sterol carrier protein
LRRVVCLTIRAYREGDETKVVDFFNEHFKNFIHLPKTVDSWRWSYLKRPEVSTEGIFVVERANKIVGYAVVGIPRGGMHLARLYEYCYPEGDKAVATGLMKRCISYARRNKALGMIFVPNKLDESFLDLYQKMGFISRPNKYHVLTYPINDFQYYEKIFDALNDRIEKLPSCKKALEGSNSNFSVHLKPSHEAFDSRTSFAVQIQNGKFNVKPEETGTFDATIECDTTTFIKLIVGTVDLTRAFVTRKIKVSPVWKFSLVLGIFSKLPPPSPIYIPYGEWLTH